VSKKKKNQARSQSIFSNVISILLYCLAFIFFVIAFAVYAAAMIFIIYLTVVPSYLLMGLLGLLVGIPFGIVGIAGVSYPLFKLLKPYIDYYRLTGIVLAVTGIPFMWKAVAELIQNEEELLRQQHAKNASLPVLDAVRARSFLKLALKTSLIFIIFTLLFSFFAIFLLGFLSGLALNLYRDEGLVGTFIYFPLFILFFAIPLWFPAWWRAFKRRRDQSQKKKTARHLNDANEIREIEHLPTDKTMQELISQDGEIPDDAFSQSEQ